MARLTHLALHVPSLETCLEFYQRFTGMHVVHQRGGTAAHPKRIVWMSEPGREHDFVFVLMGGGSCVQLAAGDYRHFGFAVKSKAEVDRIAALALDSGCLLWPARQEPFPVGYYCGVQDPAGNQLEFSYGQPLGPDSPSW